ncbi:MAG: hypothetical protein HYX78_08250 [Armatimonadetes bacterium]|nr:hypothetical protein [Armatimonadota bacterium]
MNLRRYGRLHRLISVVAIAAMIVPLFLAVLAPQRAEAQILTPMQVGVVEFRNDSGVQGDLLARFATDAVVIELSKSNRFDVITRSQLETQMKDLGFAPPLSKVELSRLGESLAAESMIEGAIKAVEVRGAGASRRAAVTLVVRMVDQASGEVVNGAIQTGFSNVRVGYEADDDKLITEAINNGAYLAVKTMIDYIIPEATVLNTIRTNEVMLNKGARDGIRAGMRMIVTREREIIGELSVRDVDPDNSTALVTKAMRGISPEDKAKAVFDMPEVARVKADPGTRSGSPPVAGKKSNSFGKLKNVLLGALALFAVASIFNSSGTESVGSVTAEAGLSGYALPVESGTAGVRVRWDAGKLSKGKNVLEYHVWRNDVPGPVLVANVAEGESFDDATARNVSWSSANNETHARTSGTTTVPAMNLGRPYKYYVSALYLVESAGGAQYFETDRSATGQATPIAQVPQVDLRLPQAMSQQNLQQVTFEWLSRRGADTYVVEASTNSTFSNPEYVSSPVYFSPLSDGQPVRLEAKSALASKFSNVSSDQPIWWRVGARASTDRPGPIPADGRSNMRYVYSEISRFYPVEMPPPLPQ